MRKIQGITWRAFLIAVSIIFVISAFSGVYISVDSASSYKKKLVDTNSFIAENIEDSLRTSIEQIDRLAVGIGVSYDVRLFFSSKIPDKLIENYYSKIKNALTAYAFSMNDMTAGFMLYSWQDNKTFSDSLYAPYYLKDSQRNLENDAEWASSITPLLETERSRVSYLFRRKNNTFPYVMTLIHQMRIDNYEGVVAVDIDLSEMYSVLASDMPEDMSLWVLNKDGEVIITEDKSRLFQQISEFDLLQDFDLSTQSKSSIVKCGADSFAFSQIYLEDLGMYVVVTTDLGNIDHTILRDNVSVMVGCLLATILIVFLVYIYTCYSSSPMRRVLELVRDPKQVLSKYPEEDDPLICEAAEYILSQLQENNVLLEELEKRMVSFRNTQLQALKAQINPHFLFNTLNNIIMLVNDDGVDSCAAQVAMNLSDVLRFALSDENLALLCDELENSKKYTQILEVRYGGKFQYVFDVDDRLLEVKVPRLVLQPLIENAVFHGLSAKEDDDCKLIIRCYPTQISNNNDTRNYVRVEVVDNGVGMSQEKVDILMQNIFDESISMNNIGVANVARRLKLLYPSDSNFEIKSKEGAGTTVSLTFPASDIKFKENLSIDSSVL